MRFAHAAEQGVPIRKDARLVGLNSETMFGFATNAGRLSMR
jgi:hypothetical protein